MAHEIGGTFTLSQFERFKAYALAQKEQVAARIDHLAAEILRTGNLAFAYSADGTPTDITSDSPHTYCGKLYAAYAALGGDAQYDLQVRSSSQALFLIAGSETRSAQLMSNGEVLGVPGLADAPSSVIIQKMKSFVASDLQRRRDYLERKMRRALDYVDQMNAEIIELKAIQQTATVDGTLEYFIEAIKALALDNNYMAVTNDAESDPYGKLSHAPIAPYMPGPKGAKTSGYTRVLGGTTKPT